MAAASRAYSWLTYAPTRSVCGPVRSIHPVEVRGAGVPRGPGTSRGRRRAGCRSAATTSSRARCTVSSSSAPNARHDGLGAGDAEGHQLLPGQEGAQEDAGGVGPKHRRAPPHDEVVGPLAGRSRARPDAAVACWRVDSRASVDSAPWFSLRPSGISPSYPPPLTRVEHGDPDVVGAAEPRLAAEHLSVPVPRRRSRQVTARDRPRGARVGERGHLDGLLVEPGPRLPRRPAVSRAHRPVRGRRAHQRSRGRPATPAAPGRGPASRRRPAGHRRRSAPRAARRSRSAGEAPARATPCRARSTSWAEYRAAAQRRPGARAPPRVGADACRISAAPRAAKAIACRSGERGAAARSNPRYARAEVRRRPTARPPYPSPRAPAPSSPRRRPRRSSHRRGRAGCAPGRRRRPRRGRTSGRSAAARTSSGVGWRLRGRGRRGRGPRRRRSTRARAGGGASRRARRPRPRR